MEWCFFPVDEYTWQHESPSTTILLFLMKGSSVTNCRHPDTTVGPKIHQSNVTNVNSTSNTMQVGRC